MHNYFCSFSYGKICVHVLSLLGMLSSVLLACYSASFFDNAYPDILNLVAYCFIFVCLPILLLILLWNRHPLRLYAAVAVAIIIPTSLWQYWQSSVITDTDLSNYLKDNSEFNAAAALVLPDRENLNDCEAISYCHSQGNMGLGFEIIELVTVYKQDTFPAERRKVDERFALCLGAMAGMPYYFTEDTDGIQINSHSYDCFTFSIEGRNYAIAHSECSEANSISYIFISSDILSSASVLAALEGSGFKPQIIMSHKSLS